MIIVKHHRFVCDCEVGPREWFRSKDAPNDRHSLASQRTRPARRRDGPTAVTPPDQQRSREAVVYNRSVCGGVCGRRRQEQTKTERGVRRNTEYVCMHAWGGAGIPPEPQLTQTQKNIAAWQTCRAWIQLWHNFTGFSASILPKYRPLARSQKGNWNSIISAQNNTSEVPVRALCTRPMRHAICLSAGWLFIWGRLENGSTQSTLIFKNAWAFYI